MSEVTTLLKNYSHGQRDFSGMSLTDANLSHADLKGADLSYSELSNIDLSQANLRGADLSYATLSQVDLHDADLRGAMLIGTDLRDAKLQDANLKDADYIPGSTHFPTEFDPQRAQMSAIKLQANTFKQTNTSS
ncbi:MAG: pentapeptide repeat-containing protein [Cyanobacteria bacterium P01_C01_bin.118]